MKKMLITGSSGLIGSEAVSYFENRGYRVLGMDNNMRFEFFGPEGDTKWNLKRLLNQTKHFEHYNTDIRDRHAIFDFFNTHRPDVIIHCAAQPSHDFAKDRPIDDFEINALGTLNLLEATRRYTTDSPFLFMSTNKVYGDAPNEIPTVELKTRYDYSRPQDYHGVNENCRIDQSMHSLFGASKVAADILTQEYGRYYEMSTVCFRGGCLTGPGHSGVQLHGFLSYLVKVAVQGKPYTIFGYKGKQVRDQIHSEDVIHALDDYVQHPRPGAVYNIGGGRENNASILECIEKLEDCLRRKIRVNYVDVPRKGDHICYISDMRKLKSHYPHWHLTRSLDDILEELISFEIDTK